MNTLDILQEDQTAYKDLLEARIDEKRRKGRPRTMWMDNIKYWLNLSYKECIKNAQNREKWRSITFNLPRADET